jgi:hypothetical protein
LIGQLLGIGGVHGVTSDVRLAAGAVLVAWIVVLLEQLRRGRLSYVGRLGATGHPHRHHMALAVLHRLGSALAALSRKRWLLLAAVGATAFLIITQVFLPLA